MAKRKLAKHNLLAGHKFIGVVQNAEIKQEYTKTAG